MDVLCKRGDVLGALIGDPGNSVVVDDDLRRRNRTIGLSRNLRSVAGLRNHGVHNGAVRDPSGAGKKFATLALDLLGGGFAPR